MNEITQADSEHKCYLFDFLGIFLVMKDTIKRLLEKPKFWLIYLLVIVAPLLPFMIRYRFNYGLIEERIINSGISQEQLEFATVQTVLLSSMNMSIFSVVSFLTLGTLIYATSRLFGLKGRAKHYFAVVGYSYVIQFMYIIISVALSFITEKPTFDDSLRYLLSTLNIETGIFISSVFGMVSVFVIWRYIFIVQGLSVLESISKKKAAAITGMVFILIAFSKGLFKALPELI